MSKKIKTGAKKIVIELRYGHPVISQFTDTRIAEQTPGEIQVTVHGNNDATKAVYELIAKALSKAVQAVKPEGE